MKKQMEDELIFGEKVQHRDFKRFGILLQEYMFWGERMSFWQSWQLLGRTISCLVNAWPFCAGEELRVSFEEFNWLIWTLFLLSVEFVLFVRFFLLIWAVVEENLMVVECHPFDVCVVVADLHQMPTSALWSLSIESS